VKEDILKMTFISLWGMFAYRVMPFGLCNALAIFQRFMNNVLEPYIGLYVQVFLAIMSCIALGMVIVATTKLNLQRRHLDDLHHSMGCVCI
jgi:hypothetical protein